ncbi:MAG: hypothetical protein PHN82_02410 [bacterium]|nr:hypothetical protein [bacterium]
MKGISVLLAACLVLSGVCAAEGPDEEAAREAPPETVEPVPEPEAAAEEPVTGPEAVRMEEGPEAEAVEKPSYRSEVGRKLRRGAVNLCRAGTEFYVQPMEARRTGGSPYAMFWPGIGEASGMFLTRMFGGLIEVVTCAVPFPNGWEPFLDE